MYFSKLLLADIIDFGASKGIDKDDLYKKIGVILSPDKNFEQFISYDEMVNAIKITSQAINDDFLGLHLGEAFQLKGTEQVDKIMQSSLTLEEALTNAVDYSKLISDALSCEIEEIGDYTMIWFSVNPDFSKCPQSAIQQIIDMTLVCTFKAIYFLTNKNHIPLEIYFNYPAPKNRSPYYRIFDCSINFNEAVSGIKFPSPLLKQSTPSKNQGLLNKLKRLADEEFEKIKIEPYLLTQVKRIILNSLPLRLTIREVASTLHFSTRTLQRNLNKLQTTFKKTEKEILLQLANKMLSDKEQTIDEISYLLGFSESSSFIRFFKSEMNTSPQRYRISILGKTS